MKSNTPEKASESTKDSALAFQPVPSTDEEEADVDEMADAADTEVRVETPAIQIPANLNLSTSASAMIRFSESGVDESVMLAYITNSAAEFDLGADEIIYLNDLGVPTSVIRGMIEHDVLLKSAAKQTGAPPNGVTVEKNSPPPVNEMPAPEYVALPGPGPSPDGAFTEEPAPTPPPDDYDPSAAFNDALAPYGTWVDVRGYGRCWQPAAVMGNPNWRPYWDRGHWVSTDCGWYWSSEYSWGWAPFHYGRWFQHPQVGWCWSPDSVWGPSWVTWRSSMDICGWAPLPPGAGFMRSGGFAYNGRLVSANFNFGLAPASFNFISLQYFCDPHPYRHGISRDHATHNFGATVASTKIVKDHNKVINNGLAPDHVAAATHKPIVPVQIRPATGGTRGDRLDSDGRTLTVYRPPLRPQVRTVAAAPIPGSPAQPSGRPTGGFGTVPPQPIASPRSSPGGTVASISSEETRVIEPVRITATPQAPAHPTEIHPSLPAPTHNIPISHPPIQPMRTETMPEKFPPHSLIVIGKKESASHQPPYSGIRRTQPAATPQSQAPVETVASTPQAETPSRYVPQAPANAPQAPEPRWSRPQPTQPTAPPIQPERHQAVAAEIPQRSEPPVVHHQAPAPAVEQPRSAPAPRHEAPPPAPVPAAANASGQRDTQRR